MNTTPLYIIPARGGSKGIPGKNIKPLAGRPLIAYSIDVARELTDDSHILLSTDDEKIASVARSLGLDVPYKRPAELATDTSGSREVILDAMDYADRAGIKYDCVVLLQPTSPMRTAADVKGCLDLYAQNPGVDMVTTVTAAAVNPYYNCFETDADGFIKVSKGDGMYTRRQDAPAAWTLNGAVYVINPASIREMPMGAFSRRLPYEMPSERSVDLDSMIDWTLTELLLQNNKNQ